MDCNNSIGEFEEFVLDIKSEDILSDVTIEISDVQVQENHLNENVSEFETDTICNDVVNSENSVIINECVEDIKPRINQDFDYVVTEVSQLETEENDQKEDICGLNKVSDELEESDASLTEEIDESSTKLKKKTISYHIFDVNDHCESNNVSSDSDSWTTLMEPLIELIHTKFKITKVIFPKKESVGNNFSRRPESPVSSEEKMDSSSTFESGYLSETDSSSTQSSPTTVIPNTFHSNNDFCGFDNIQSTSGLQSIKRERCDSNSEVGTIDNYEDTENVSMLSYEDGESSHNPDFYIKRHKTKSKLTKRDQEKADLLFARQLHGTINRHHLKRSKPQMQSDLHDF